MKLSVTQLLQFCWNQTCNTYFLLSSWIPEANIVTIFFLAIEITSESPHCKNNIYIYPWNWATYNNYNWTAIKSVKYFWSVQTWRKCNNFKDKSISKEFNIFSWPSRPDSSATKTPRWWRHYFLEVDLGCIMSTNDKLLCHETISYQDLIVVCRTLLSPITRLDWPSLKTISSWNG